MSYSITPDESCSDDAVWRILESRDRAILKLRNQQHNAAQLKHELQQMQIAYQSLEERYQAAEFDRAERLKVIEKQGQDLANLQALIHQAQAGIAQYQTELELVSQQLKQTQNKAQQQQQQLADSQTKLAATKTKLRQARSRMNKQKADLQDLNTQLLVSRAETEAMQTSKFWRLRNQWMKVKKIFE